jgi:hypothetical protein
LEVKIALPDERKKGQMSVEEAGRMGGENI